MLDKKINFPFESEKIIQVAYVGVILVLSNIFTFKVKCMSVYKLVEDMDETQKLIKFL